MPRIEVDVPDSLEVEVERLVQEDEFVTEQAAVESLLETGIQAYQPPETTEDEPELFEEEMRETSERSMDDDPYEY